MVKLGTCGKDGHYLGVDGTATTCQCGEVTLTKEDLVARKILELLGDQDPAVSCKECLMILDLARVNVLHYWQKNKDGN